MKDPDGKAVFGIFIWLLSGVLQDSDRATKVTSKGIVDAKIQLISGHKNRESLSIYQDLSLADIEKEYWSVMKSFPVQ
ncbi:MAG: hypothetical protein ABIK53_05260 [bacterium]